MLGLVFFQNLSNLPTAVSSQNVQHWSSECSFIWVNFGRIFGPVWVGWRLGRVFDFISWGKECFFSEIQSASRLMMGKNGEEWGGFFRIVDISPDQWSIFPKWVQISNWTRYQLLTGVSKSTSLCLLACLREKWRVVAWNTTTFFAANIKIFRFLKNKMLAL